MALGLPHETMDVQGPYPFIAMPQTWGMNRRRFLAFFLVHTQPSNFEEQSLRGSNEVLDGQEQNEFDMQQGFFLYALEMAL